MSSARHMAPRRSVAAWWTSSAKRPALWRAIAAMNLIVGAGGVVALAAYAPPAINVGALPEGALQRVVSRPPQPVPDSITVPSIGVNTTLETLDIGADGVLSVPRDYAAAGWWASGPRPGADGAAVVVGHVDSTRGPAVFYRLRSLAVGAEIRVHRVDNTTAVFVVDAIRQFRKTTLPTATVYGPTAVPSLRLITCGGSFDNKAKSYRDNLVVFAHLVEDKSVEL
ncbi:MAG TPA: class F sortase [Acidimicrobiales bacterium]|nr:class F sortase [Acidimicrobiales bacterium]